DLDDFVFPLFVGPEAFENPELPALGRHSVESLAAEANELERLGVRSVLLFDVCLCEYTSHGHCGALDGDDVDNDSTLELLARTAVSHAEAGADAVCP